MKRLKKLLAIMLASVCACGVMAGCGGRAGHEDVDETKTQVYVGNFDAGVGTQWLHEAAARFETAYANTSFEEGKMGVQVFVDPQANYNGGGIIDSFGKNKNYVMFSEQVNYNEFVKKGLLLDITDLITKENFAGEGTLLSKMLDSQQESLKINDKYYALPHYQIFPSIIYDVDLFEEEKLYISANKNNGNSGITISKTEQKSVGPDGVSGTDDDGFPATFDEFKTLIEYMSNRNITPFIWTGKHVGYLQGVANSIVASYNGQMGMTVQASFDSKGEEIEIVTGFDGNEQPILDNVVITPETGYLSRQVSGLYYGMEMTEFILSKDKYSSSSSRNGTDTQTDAQEEFIFSRFDKENYDRQPIAFLCDGGYWEIEAETTMELFREEYPDDMTGGRNFGRFPLPTLEGQTPTLNDKADCYGFINANIANDPIKIAVAKEFLEFLYSNAELEAFTVRTGVTRGLKYDLSNESYEKLSTFQKQVWDDRKAGDWTTIFHNNNTFIANFSTFSLSANSSYWKTMIDGTSYSTLYGAIYDSKKTAEEYFMGRWITPAAWTTQYYVA